MRSQALITDSQALQALKNDPSESSSMPVTGHVSQTRSPETQTEANVGKVELQQLSETISEPSEQPEQALSEPPRRINSKRAQRAAGLKPTDALPGYPMLLRGANSAQTWTKLGLEAGLQARRAQETYHCTEPGCNKSFKRQNRLKAHMHLHKGTQPFKCSFPGCKKAFSENQNLAIHQRIHNDERPFVCPQNCGKSFRTKGNMQDHERRHFGDKPFRCAHCSTLYYRKNVLKAHQERCQARTLEQTAQNVQQQIDQGNSDFNQKQNSKAQIQLSSQYEGSSNISIQAGNPMTVKIREFDGQSAANLYVSTQANSALTTAHQGDQNREHQRVFAPASTQVQLPSTQQQLFAYEQQPQIAMPTATTVANLPIATQPLFQNYLMAPWPVSFAQPLAAPKPVLLAHPIQSQRALSGSNPAALTEPASQSSLSAGHAQSLESVCRVLELEQRVRSILDELRAKLQTVASQVQTSQPVPNLNKPSGQKPL